jgi:hypothetical protein
VAEVEIVPKCFYKDNTQVLKGRFRPQKKILIIIYCLQIVNMEMYPFFHKIHLYCIINLYLLEKIGEDFATKRLILIRNSSFNFVPL